MTSSGSGSPQGAQGTGAAFETSAPGIAVIGLAGRVPRAGDLFGFWSALAEGREMLTTSDADGVAAAHGVVPDGDLFDADFFGYAPSEALLMDPQQRVFLECAWEALEHAGYDPYSDDQVVGVYAGCGDTGHLHRLHGYRDHFPEVSDLQLHLGGGGDFLTARVAYKLGLTGPAVTVQAACATGLVAVHVAAQALLAGECDMALAGGITLHVPFPHDQRGEDGIVAPDGHCRAFDVGASGTVVSDGAGIVVLKRLEDALADGDHVHAVLLGSAVTNDGARKVGFTAPSVDGVAAAARAALVVADVDPATVDYVEGHGTGTPAGDPIEVRGLSKGYAGAGAGSLLLGSVKSNIGHTDVAAGVLGLLKVVLGLRHELIPATLHFRVPNPGTGLAESPFRVNAEPLAWPRRDRPRRAGVSSLGLGGTNAHVIVEEAPPVDQPDELTETHHLLPLSARSPAALAATAARLGEHLNSASDAPIDDVAWTLQVGRHPHAHRAFAVVTDRDDAVRTLTTAAPGRLTMSPRPAPADPSEVTFLFSGHGGQHTGMAGDLYDRWPVFRAELDTCAELIAPRLGLDVREVLFPEHGDGDARQRLSTMAVGQPSVFAVEYALAVLWQSWNVRPSAVTGHSLGAYAAATTAGVLSLPDAVALVVERGRLMDATPAGSMLAVSAPAEALTPRLGPKLSLAAVNGPDQCVVSGPADAVAAFQEEMALGGVDVRLLHISTAAHSQMMQPALTAFGEAVASVRLNPPSIRWISDTTGSPVTPEEATDPAYWTAHMRRTVDFAAALDTVLKTDAALVEVGPGRTLAGLVRRHPAHTADRVVVASMPHASDEVAGSAVLLAAAGRLWQAGVPIDWPALHDGRCRRRVPLPTYPFERQRFLLGAEADAVGTVPVEQTPVGTNPVEQPNPPAPLTDTEAVVAAAYRTILGVDPVDPHRDFFELGGDSLLAARVAAILRRELGEFIGVRTVFVAPTVAGLAAAIDDRRTAGA